MAEPDADPVPPPEPTADDGRDARPRWPAWFAPAGFVTAAWLVVVSAIVIGALARALGVPRGSPALSIGQTLLQDFLLIATAVLFASRVSRPRAWHFGLGRAPWERSLRWVGMALGAYMAFLVVAFVYRELFEP